jgi:hypothetical protein
LECRLQQEPLPVRWTKDICAEKRFETGIFGCGFEFILFSGLKCRRETRDKSV